MATISSVPSDLPLEQLDLYYATDPYLSSLLIFYGPVATTNATVSSSRIEAHIVSAAGLQCYSRITISPAAPLYAAVGRLPREKQGDEVCRALAVSTLKYFLELPGAAKQYLIEMALAGKPEVKVPKIFDEIHAADLANRMTLVENSSAIVQSIRGAFQERKVSWIDIDVVLPMGTIQLHQLSEPDNGGYDEGSDLKYGPYSSLIEALGSPVFLPTSRLKRAPSQPTNLCKSRLFSKTQKQALRLSMCELVDTEERYVGKLYTLVHTVAEEFRLNAERETLSSSGPDGPSLAALFPVCLNEILEVNMGFLGLIRHVLETTEVDAIADMADDTEFPSSHCAAPKGKEDPIGIAEFAKALHEWLPRFSRPYADYMRAHKGFSQILNAFMKDENSSFSKRVHDTGEQTLRSLLMEPVQRLPRYSLLIDTMTSNLPLIHPALRSLLKARDKIKDICSLDNPLSVDYDQGIRRLREIVIGWPAALVPAGRLISAVDVSRVPPPYYTGRSNTNLDAGILLIYKNCLVLLSKATGSNITSRGLLAELDNAFTCASESASIPSAELKVAQLYDLHALRYTQSACGRILFLVPASHTKLQTDAASIMDTIALKLLGMYEGRANRLLEEIVKAGIEGRFPDNERENGKWTLRAPTGTAGKLGVLACVFEGDQGAAMNRTRPSKIRVVFDTPKEACRKMLDSFGLEVIVSISLATEGQYRVDIDSIIGNASSDMVMADNFVHILSRRFLNLLPILHSTQNRSITESIMYTNFEIVRYLTSTFLAQVKPPRVFRPPSPTKLLSNLLGSGQSKGAALNATPPGSTIMLNEFPKMPPPRADVTRSNALLSNRSSEGDASNGISIVGLPPSSGETDNSCNKLEQTFAAYILALQSRSGNVVGCTLRARGNIDRSTVNELYNVLLDDPAKIQVAAEVPVDTLFVAFETFMANAWRISMGPVLESASLALMQIQYDTMSSVDFDKNFRKLLVEMSPQNRRALAVIVQLLSELLDASGNDGDRGALTAAFAEILAVDGEPMRYISLLDRLVDDFDNLFDEYIPYGTSLEETLSCDEGKLTPQNTGSIGSNTSSFRKRFGFSLHRDNSKYEGESKMSSILRSLSKSKGSGDSEPSTPKGSVLRAKSTDIYAGVEGSFLRPSSRGHIDILAPGGHLPCSNNDLDQFIPSSSTGGVTQSTSVKIRRKRRSSLSDLRPTTFSTDSSSTSPIQLRRPDTPSYHMRPESTAPATQSQPLAIYGPTSTAKNSSPATGSSISHLPPSKRSSARIVAQGQKENVDPRSIYIGLYSPTKAKEGPSPSEQDPGPRFQTANGHISRSVGLRERPTVVSSLDIKRFGSLPSAQKMQKPRMQSPQKLRDRLQNEKKVQASSQQSLKNEIDHISNDMYAMEPVLALHSDTVVNSHEAGQVFSTEFLSRIRSLEARLKSIYEEFSARTDTIERDFESSLIISEKRAKKLDELYRETSAENEALYDRFNVELSKVANDARLGSTDEALKSQLSAALEEVGRLKKENLRLKREVGGLRAQQAAIALWDASK